MGSTDDLVLTQSSTELPLDYSAINLIPGVADTDQLAFRRDFTIDPAYEVTVADKRRLGIILNSWVTINSTTKTIDAVNVPSGYQVVLDNGTVYTLPDWWENNPVLGEQTLFVDRQSPIEDPLVTWSAGSRLTSNQLNLEVSQLLHLIQEVQSDVDNAVILLTDGGTTDGPYLGGILDMQGFRIINLGLPTGDNDAVSKAFGAATYLNKTTDKNIAGGWVALDGSTKIPSIYLPDLSTLGGAFFAQESAPSVDNAPGSVWVQLSTKDVYVLYDNDDDTLLEWTLVYSSTDPVVYNVATFFQSSAPTDATYGADIPFASLWFNTTDGSFYRRIEDDNAADSGYWVDSSGADGAPASQSAILSTTAPSSPALGAIWHNPNTGKTYVYSSANNGWVQT
jgi:hypothetical protein